MIAEAIYFSQYQLKVWISVYSLTIDFMFNSAFGGLTGVWGRTPAPMG
jgi:hypothetical protein